MYLFNRRLPGIIRNMLVHDELVADVRVSEAASLLVLSQAGLQVDSTSYDTMIERLAAVKERVGATPEDVQLALCTHELSLAVED